MSNASVRKSGSARASVRGACVSNGPLGRPVLSHVGPAGSRRTASGPGGGITLCGRADAVSHQAPARSCRSRGDPVCAHAGAGRRALGVGCRQSTSRRPGHLGQASGSACPRARSRCTANRSRGGGTAPHRHPQGREHGVQSRAKRQAPHPWHGDARGCEPLRAQQRRVGRAHGDAIGAGRLAGQGACRGSQARPPANCSGTANRQASCGQRPGRHRSLCPTRATDRQPGFRPERKSRSEAARSAALSSVVSRASRAGPCSGKTWPRPAGALTTSTDITTWPRSTRERVGSKSRSSAYGSPRSSPTMSPRSPRGVRSRGCT